MKVLIVTEPDDIHAALVKLALEKKGVDCELFFSADMPSRQKNTVFISSNACSWDSTDGNVSCAQFDNNFDAIWWRRPRKPHLPHHIHEKDKQFVEIENSIYHDSIPYLLSEKACWINPIASHQKTRSKIVQLKLAQLCQFKLPETLISNSPEQIKSFIKSNEPQSVVYKPFTPSCWFEKERIKIAYTDKICIHDLPSDSMLQAVPGIYQKYIQEKYQLRITCFGTYISAIKIESHQDGSQQDWRIPPYCELKLSEVTLTQSIKNKIILFMIKIGIVFGSFDFIVTKDEDIIFLELNEQGQFLWMEEIKPSLCYLDIFSEFIINKRFDFSWRKPKNALHAGDLSRKALSILEDNIHKHVSQKCSPYGSVE